MKTTNNVQKAITKSLAVVISLVLISITVNAQDFWKTVLENNSFNQIAMAMTSESKASPATADANSSTEATTYAEFAAVETEESMNVEDWMLNETNFFTTLEVETEVENHLELENWMTNENLFNGTADYFEVDTEENLEVEDWMKNSEYFGVQTVEMELEIENTLEVEAWMTDNNTWKM